MDFAYAGGSTINGFIVALVSAVTVGVQPIPAGMKVGLSIYLQAGYGGLKAELSEAADMMPEADYGFRPGAASERDLKTKSEFVKALADSFTACDEAFGTLTDANANEYMKVGQGEVVRSAVLTGILAHNSEMYGIATVYLRAKNLVPPSTTHQTQGR